MNSKRIEYIDFLKFVGLTGILLAHVGSPRLIFMLRNFDVPLMIILSSLLAEISVHKCCNSATAIFEYYVSRIKRLVIPTWIFLCIFFGISFALGRCYDWKYYIYSFLLTRYGVGYVWVMLMYLFSALTVPIFYKIKHEKTVVLCLCFLYILYEVAYRYQIGIHNKFIETFCYYIIPYGGVLTYLGCNYSKMNKAKYVIPFVALLIFMLFGFYYWQAYGQLRSVQFAKYPPRSYYLSYGIMISFGLLYLCEKYNFKIYKNSIVKFISSHSLWIYLWHIGILAIYSLFKLPEVWFVKFVVVYSLSITLTYIVNLLLDLIEKKRTFKMLKYFRG